MPTPVKQTRPPIVLIVDDQEWSSRSLESVLTPNGYAVMRAFTASTGFERALAQLPDLVFISGKLPNGDGVGLCRNLRKDPQFNSSIPILIMSSERPTRAQRLVALEAGAWDLVSHPIDAAELLLRLDSYMRAKFEIDRAREQLVTDELTGLYNLRGLEQRAEEIRSHAQREKQSLACVVIAPAVGAATDQVIDEEQMAAMVPRLGKILKAAGRGSDVIGRLGRLEFAILAPSTTGEGAVKLAERLASAIRTEQQEKPNEAPLNLRAGYDVVANVGDTPVAARDLLVHATQALRDARLAGSGEWIRPFASGETLLS